MSLKVGKTKKLSVKNNPIKRVVIWSSDNEAVVKVDSSGKLTALGKGKTTIRAKVNGQESTCEISVK